MKVMEHKHNILLSIGSNYNTEYTIPQIFKLLKTWWSGVEATDCIETKAIGMPEETHSYRNCLVRFRTSLEYDEVNALCKVTEQQCGDNKELRSQSKIAADLDILQYDETRHHEKDWERAYIKELLSMPFKIIVALVLLCLSCTDVSAQEIPVKDILGRAIEYFGGQKYEEALLMFKKIEKTHKLSKRIQAYKGVCLYKSNEFNDAIGTLSPVVDSLTEYPPHEQSVYYYALAESHFQLGQYRESIPILKKTIAICEDTDKAEVLYRLGFCSMLYAEYEDAIDYFSEAELFYDKTEPDEIIIAHRQQARNMLRGLLVAHGPRRVDVGNKEAGNNQNQSASNEGSDVDNSPKE